LLNGQKYAIKGTLANFMPKIIDFGKSSFNTTTPELDGLDEFVTLLARQYQYPVDNEQEEIYDFLRPFITTVGSSFDTFEQVLSSHWFEDLKDIRPVENNIRACHLLCGRPATMKLPHAPSYLYCNYHSRIQLGTISSIIKSDDSFSKNTL
jgi:hypothetical protein